MSQKNTPASDDKDVIDVEATEQKDSSVKDNGELDDISSRAPLTAAVLKGVEAARTLVQGQLKVGEDVIGEFEKKAKEIVDSVQKGVDSVGGRVREESKEAMSRVREEGKDAMNRVREESKEAVGRFESLRKTFGKLPLRVDLESWVDLPADAREELLGALGIASDRKIDKLQETVDALRLEIADLLLTQAEAIKTEFKRSRRSSRGGARKSGAAAKKPAQDAKG